MRWRPWAFAWVVIGLGWCVGSAFAAVWVWRFGWTHGPVPGGCGCFNPGALLFSVVWGVVGAVAAVLVWSAVAASAGLGLFLRLGRSSAEAEALHALRDESSLVGDMAFGRQAARPLGEATVERRTG
jgi:hypothetical protein